MEKLPDFYAVKCETEEETNIVANIIKGEKTANWKYRKYVLNKNNIGNKRTDSIICDSVDEFDVLIIHFKEWKRLYFKQDEEELIGYKYNKLGLENIEIISFMFGYVYQYTPTLHENLYNFKINSNTYNRLKKAGVLDIWCTPVYRKKETIMKFGDVEFKIDNSGKFAATNHGKVEYIEIKELCIIFQQLKRIKLAAHNLIVPDTIQIGCKTCKISELEEIEKAMLNLQNQ